MAAFAHISVGQLITAPCSAVPEDKKCTLSTCVCFLDVFLRRELAAVNILYSSNVVCLILLLRKLYDR